MTNVVCASAQWVRRQRERHREKKLSAERVEKLKAIDPDIFKTAIGWEHKFQELVGKYPLFHKVLSGHANSTRHSQ